MADQEPTSPPEKESSEIKEDEKEITDVEEKPQSVSKEDEKVEDEAKTPNIEQDVPTETNDDEGKTDTSTTSESEADINETKESSKEEVVGKEEDEKEEIEEIEENVDETEEEQAPESTDETAAAAVVELQPEVEFQEDQGENYPPPEPKSHTERLQAHHKLRCYESRRRKAYGSKLSSSSLYWRSFRELIRDSLRETIRAERIVYAHIRAQENYSDHMRAVFEDVLDDDFNPVQDEKQKKKLLSFKRKTAKKDGKFTLGDLDELDAQKDDQFLKSMIESQNILADRYEECAESLTDTVSSEVTSLRMQLEKQIKHMETLGNAILDQLEAAEKEVISAWDNYYSEAQKTMPTGKPSLLESTSVNRRGACLTKNTNQPPSITPIKDCSDLWITEVHYRMAVAFLSTSWEKCSGELSRLFASMKETECSRRHRLRELLVIFLQKEERLWMSLPAVMSPVLKEFTDRTMDREAISEDVQTTIRLRAQGIQRKEESEMKKLMSGPGLSTELVKDGNFELSSPLTSDELCMVKVMEMKPAGMMRSWKSVLAIITNDSFLHLFLLPRTMDTDPELAFHGLVPEVEIPTDQNMQLLQASKSTPKMWNDNLKPSDSIALPNCKVYFANDGVSYTFELTETVFNHGAGKLFGKISDRKILFRTSSYEDAKKWVAYLMAAK